MLNSSRIFYRLFKTASYMRTSEPMKQKTTPKKKCFIQCKRVSFDAMELLPSNSKFGSIPLASSGWNHHKSKGDFFIIHPTVEEHVLSEHMININSICDDVMISSTLVENLKANFNITQFTPIQREAFPKIYKGFHVLIAAETGCGKTLTYLMPIIQKVLDKKNIQCSDRKLNTPLVLILSPGRELAEQIGYAATQLCQSTALKVKTVVGGNTKKQMVNPNFTDVDILIGTIGAVSKLVTTGIFRMEQVEHVVLDEADTLLDDSFSEKLEYFLKRFPFHRYSIENSNEIGVQLVLASATMPTNVSLSLKNIVDVSNIQQIVSKNLHRLMPHIQQKFLRTNKQDRPAIILSSVKSELSKNRPTIIFSNKSSSCDYISLFLDKNGVNCVNLNGDMLMKIRVGKFQQFQNGEVNVLSTTDVGSRGLDTIRAKHVINFDFPLYIADYIHRIGRIGRIGASKTCFATNLISSRREIHLVQKIEHSARTGGLLENVNANISNLIRQRMMKDLNMKVIENSIF